MSRYFIICTTLLESPDCGDKLMQLRRDLAGKGMVTDAFHATSDKQEVRDEVFALLSDMNFRIDATILEKSKAQPQCTVDEHTFYKYAWFYHLKYLGPRIVRGASSINVTAASLGTKKKKALFNDVLNNVARETLGGIDHQTNFWPAATDPCLQLADYCAWAIQRKWERNDLRSYDLISDKIHSEYDLWSRGTIHYF